MSERQTGRTSRMMDEAFSLAKEGRAVYVIAANGKQVDWFRGIYGRKADLFGIKFETAESCGYDWQYMTLTGAHPNCVVLVDHFAIEHKFRYLLDAAHKYDIPTREDSNE